jgi:hypothetical protein
MTMIIRDYACSRTYDVFNPEHRDEHESFYALDTDDDAHLQATHIVLSHICRALRKFVLGSPELWSHVDSRMSPNELRAHLSRSSDVELSITLHEPSRNERIMSRFWVFLGIVLIYDYRWTKLEVRPRKEYWCIGDGPFYGILAWNLRDANIAKLESLSMKFHFDEEFGPRDTQQRRFDWDWKTLKLRRLHMTELLYASVPAYYSSLTTLQVILPTNTFNAPYRLDDVVKLLASTPVLEEFHFETIERISARYSDTAPRADKGVALPKLRQLFFSHTEHFQTNSEEVMTRFMELVHAPNLITYGCGMSSVTPMRQEFQPGSAGVDPDYFLSFFADAGNMANVQELRIHKGYYGLPQPPLRTILQKIPRLCTLRFKDASLTEELDPLVGPLPPIGDIYFNHCDLSAVFLRSCVSMLKGSSRWSTFKAFHFRFCRGVSEKDIHTIIPSSSMTWEGLLEI